MIVLPVSQRNRVLELVHDRHGHQGPERTLQILQKRCYWPKMGDDVKEWCERCPRCQAGKKPGNRISQPMGHLRATNPLEVVALDFLKLDVASDGRENVLVMTDVFTKWSFAVPTRWFESRLAPG